MHLQESTGCRPDVFLNAGTNRRELADVLVPQSGDPISQFPAIEIAAGTEFRTDTECGHGSLTVAASGDQVSGITSSLCLNASPLQRIST